MTVRTRDQYLDALRAGPLMVVVFGHWLATLPRLQEGRMVDTEHLLEIWEPAGLLGALPGTLIGVVLVLAASWLLRQRGRRLAAANSGDSIPNGHQPARNRRLRADALQPAPALARSVVRGWAS